jgi:hypothetical protein
MFLSRIAAMADSEIPTTWANAGRSALGNSLWILPLVAFERLSEGHFDQAVIAGMAWLVALVAAVKLHVLQDLISNRERWHRLFTWGVIVLGASLLAWGIFRLANQGPPAPSQMQAELSDLRDRLTFELRAKAHIEQQLTKKEQEAQNRAAASTVAPLSVAGQDSGNPIRWATHLGWTQTTNSSGVFILLAVIISGDNVGSSAVKLKEAYISSEITGATKELKVDAGPDGKLTLDETNPVPPTARIALVADFDPPLTAKEFIDQWGKMSLHVKYDGTDFSMPFDENYLINMFRNIPAAGVGPRVTKKKQ